MAHMLKKTCPDLSRVTDQRPLDPRGISRQEIVLSYYRTDTLHTYIPHTLVVADDDVVSPLLPCSWQYRYRQEQSYPILFCSAQYRFLIWEHSYPILPDSQQYRSLIRELVNSHPMLHGSLQCGPKREQSIKRFRDT